jgi:hypothetical protein
MTVAEMQRPPGSPLVEWLMPFISSKSGNTIGYFLEIDGSKNFFNRSEQMGWDAFRLVVDAAQPYDRTWLIPIYQLRQGVSSWFGDENDAILTAVAICTVPAKRMNPEVKLQKIDLPADVITSPWEIVSTHSGTIYLGPHVTREEVEFIPLTTVYAAAGVPIPIDLTAHKRGTIDAPGAAIARPGGSEVYEVVTLENADYDETNWQPTSMSDGAQEDKQDGKTDVVSKDKDDDFVKLRFSCPLTHVAGSSEIVFYQAGTGERMQDADIRFYNSAGERVQRSALKIDDLKSPSGPLAPAFASGLDLFVEIGDLGEITGQSAQADDITRKYADLIWKITAGGTTIEQKVRIYRGGFWRADRTDNTGTIAFYDGKGRKSDGTVDYGQIVKGPYQFKTGQEGHPDETVPNEGPTPMGWYGLWARNLGNNNNDMRTAWTPGGSRPQTNHDYGPGNSRPALGFVQQGSYCQWAAPGNHNIPNKGLYGYDNGNDADPYDGMPASIHFKFELVEIGNFTTRDLLQIHPDGFCDGTLGCIGIQTYDDCCKVLFLVRHYFQSRLLVD